MVRHHRYIGSGSAAARRVITGCVDRSYREVERADSGQDSYKTAHGRSHIQRDYN